MTLYTRLEHGNLPVHVSLNENGRTVYDVEYPSDMEASGIKVTRHRSARALFRSLYGRNISMTVDRYFRLGEHRKPVRASGSADLLSLLGTKKGNHQSRITVHGRSKPLHRTKVRYAPVQGTLELPQKTSKPATRPSQGSLKTSDPAFEELLEGLEGDLRPIEEFMKPTKELVEEFEKKFALELDKVEGLVGISLGARSDRRGVKFKADEVRKLLWRGFAGKMLSQGYDPEDVLQEVYRGLLVRNNGTCPWDGRKSTFGHYVHMVTSCVLTNYHRKQTRRIDKDAVPMAKNREGGEMADIGQWGSVGIENGSEIGDMMALEQLGVYLEGKKHEKAGRAPEAVLGRAILPLVASGHQRSDIVRETGQKPSMVSRALAWLRKQTAAWAREGGLEAIVPVRYGV